MPLTAAPAVRLVHDAARRQRVSPHPGELDPAQQRAVVHRDGPVQVLGAPGTGKTTVLVEAAVDRISRDGVSPDRILILTFSRRAAADLRDQLSARLGGAMRQPVARTFHSYAFGLLRRESAQAGESAPRLLSGPEQDLIIRELLRGEVEELGADYWPAALRPALLTRGFAQQLRDLLQRAAERGVSPKNLAALGRRHGRPDWVAAARFARQYAAITALRQPPAYDPAELVRAAAGLLRNDADLLDHERAAYDFMAVDEYQEADPAQEELLQLVAGGGRDLMVLGDPDQSIYGFRGADPEVFRRFAERFTTVDGRPATVLTLSTPWRVSGDVLAAARRVGTRLGGVGAHRDLRAADPGDADQRANHRGAGHLEVHCLRSEAQQAAMVAQRLREAHLVDEVPWSEMAVLVRSAAQLPALRRALHHAGVPVALRPQDLPLVRQPAVRPLLILLELATGRRSIDAELAVELVTGPLGGADPLALRRLRQELRRMELAAGGGRSSAALLVEALDQGLAVEAYHEHAVRPARRVADLIAVTRAAAEQPEATAEDVLWATWSRSGLAERWASRALAGGSAGRAADRDLDAVVALFEAAGRFVDRLPKAGPQVFLDYLLGQEIPADTLAARAPSGDSVSLLTVHGAKGREWDFVALAGVQEGTWPDLRLRGSLLGSQLLVDLIEMRDTSAAVALSGMLAEERRLFYVGVTRARHRLLVTAVLNDEEQPSRFLDEIAPFADAVEEWPLTRPPRGLDLSSVVAELRAIVCATDSPEASTTGDVTANTARRQAAAVQLARLAAAGVRGADPADWYGLAGWSDDRPMRDPEEAVRVSPSKVEAFARCELRWLLESSGGTPGDTTTQGIGTLVHDLAFEAARGDTSPAKLLDRLDQRWSEVDVGAGWWARKQHERAAGMVQRLVSWLSDPARSHLVAAEHDFEVQVGRARLVGRVDRLERDEDGRLVVIDLKTGRTKPAKAEIPEHPQLGAYQLAVERGGFEDVAPGRHRSGGAKLVQLGSGVNASEQSQPPLHQAADPEWAATMVRDTAERMAGSAFRAVENKWCPTCPVRRSCPLFDEGRQVTP